MPRPSEFRILIIKILAKIDNNTHSTINAIDMIKKLKLN